MTSGAHARTCPLQLYVRFAKLGEIGLLFKIQFDPISRPRRNAATEEIGILSPDRAI